MLNIYKFSSARKRTVSAFLTGWLAAYFAASGCDVPEDDKKKKVEACEVDAEQDFCPSGDERPEGRAELNGVWDLENQRLVMFGGNTGVPEQCSTITPKEFISDTWAYYPSCGTWEEFTIQGPSPRGRYAFAADNTNGYGYLFGGRYAEGFTAIYTLYNDLWRFNFKTNTWGEIPTINAPPPRVNTSLVINTDSTKAYLFGGNVSVDGAVFQPVNDLWELDLTSFTWTELTPAGNPPSPRLWVAALYDDTRDRFVITDGGDETAFFNTAQYFIDVWAYDIATNAWLQLNNGLGVAPSGRFWGQWVHDLDNDKYIHFGGHDDETLGNSNDLWAFNPNSNEWGELLAGDTFNRAATGVCDFPPDFTNVADGTPERRHSQVQVYTEGECPSVLITMGKTDCGIVDDVFRYRIEKNEWEELTSARDGEICLRADKGFECEAMCL